LDNLCEKYLNEKKDKDIYKQMAELFGGLATRNVQISRISQAPSHMVGPYATKDTDLTLALWLWQNKEIERQGVERIIEFEKRLMPTIIRSEVRGIRVDLDEAHRAADKITPIIDNLQAKINEEAGFEFNINSSPHVKKYFSPVQKDGNWFVGDTMIGKTGTGAPSLGADSLREITHPMAMAILELRSLVKTRDTFLMGHVIGHAHNGRVYPTINQNKGETGGTGSGRLSYQGPAMQQIPNRNKKVAQIIKKAFLPDEGCDWVDGDESSFEVRVFAHLTNNEKVVQAYNDNPMLDFHAFVADLSGLVRDAQYSGQANAKQMNLSMIFNSGNGAIAKKMGMEWEWNSFKKWEDGEEKTIVYKKAGDEAMEVINRYHSRLPGVKELANNCKKVAEQRGYIRTYTGRRIRFPVRRFSYKASGLLIQATAADINKENWMAIEDILGDAGHLILNTHDSYSLNIKKDWKKHWLEVKAELEKPKLRVPLVLDLSGVGKTWWDAISKGKNYSEDD
jgi:DNA polymerase I-like protein with 3'-5' exonuclease and polymerase domains